MAITLEEKIIRLEHLLEVVLKNQELIKSHLWRQLGSELTPPNIPQLQEVEALNYVKNVIKPKAEGVGVQGFWQGAVLNFLKQQTLNFIGATLKQLVIEKLVDLSKWLMEQTEEQIINLYQRASEEEKKLFKNKVQEVFPDCELLKKLA